MSFELNNNQVKKQLGGIDRACHGKVVLTESGVAYGGLVRKELELG